MNRCPVCDRIFKRKHKNRDAHGGVCGGCFALANQKTEYRPKKEHKTKVCVHCQKELPKAVRRPRQPEFADVCAACRSKDIIQDFDGDFEDLNIIFPKVSPFKPLPAHLTCRQSDQTPWDSAYGWPLKRSIRTPWGEKEWADVIAWDRTKPSAEMTEVFHPGIGPLRKRHWKKFINRDGGPNDVTTEWGELELRWRRGSFVLPVNHSGETVADFLARGGKITKMAPGWVAPLSFLDSPKQWVSPESRQRGQHRRNRTLAARNDSSILDMVKKISLTGIE